ncbi:MULTISPECIES: NRDE family protein [unclassified Haloferax]|uniref:NRDE family protein n=1 Tax=unclassified Haloferax TaxID=2625095 RepID=UPI0028761B67|nr:MULTISPECIES: NRDE family protein [unclassified Haloferax]MDS0240308.1 NRDE family protein [Haloferax sp. S2CR25]MDS0443429.1 NRDE family protein [Haloferax sp. S2CR25-2]
MCTLILAWQVFEAAPVVVAANRDELLGRPAEPPRRWENGDGPAVVAPRDAEAGGTWVGYNDAGVFVGITNRWVEVDGGGERSRGHLVRDALRRETAEDAARFVERAVDDHVYDGFNLVVADENAALFFEWDGSLSVRNFDPGVRVVVNVGTPDSWFVPERRPEVGETQADNARRLEEALQPEPSESVTAWRERAKAALGDHDFGVCVHDPEGRFGTRSSSVITLGEAGFAYEFADGPPCQTAFEPVERQD